MKSSANPGRGGRPVRAGGSRDCLRPTPTGSRCATRTGCDARRRARRPDRRPDVRRVDTSADTLSATSQLRTLRLAEHPFPNEVSRVAERTPHRRPKRFARSDFVEDRGAPAVTLVDGDHTLRVQGRRSFRAAHPSRDSKPSSTRSTTARPSAAASGWLTSRPTSSTARRWPYSTMNKPTHPRTMVSKTARPTGSLRDRGDQRRSGAAPTTRSTATTMNGAKVEAVYPPASGFDRPIRLPFASNVHVGGTPLIVPLSRHLLDLRLIGPRTTGVGRSRRWRPMRRLRARPSIEKADQRPLPRCVASPPLPHRHGHDARRALVRPAIRDPPSPFA